MLPALQPLNSTSRNMMSIAVAVKGSKLAWSTKRRNLGAHYEHEQPAGAEAEDAATSGGLPLPILGTASTDCAAKQRRLGDCRDRAAVDCRLAVANRTPQDREAGILPGGQIF